MAKIREALKQAMAISEMKNTILTKHPKIALVADVENWAFHNYAI